MGRVAVVGSDDEKRWISRVVGAALAERDHADLVVVTGDPADDLGDRPGGAPLVVVGDTTPSSVMATFVVSREWSDEHLKVLLAALALGKPVPPKLLGPLANLEDAKATKLCINAVRRLSGASDLVAIETTMTEILIELFELDRAYCLYYDAESAALWSEVRIERGGEDERRATAGLSGFAARTGIAAVASPRDPRFFGANDDPDGEPDEHIVAQPVFGTDGDVHAVLILVRRQRRKPFRTEELRLLERFAQLVAPILDQHSMQASAQAILDDGDATPGLFRKEAEAAYAHQRLGDVLRVSPRWLSWAYRALVVLVAASAAFVVTGRVSTYSTGPAVIRSNARTPVAARTGGNVLAVHVAPDDRVSAGAPLARLDDSEQRAALERLEVEFDAQLRSHMLDLSDPAVEAAVRNIRHELDAARTALEERLIRAPISGVIGDVRIRAGQHVEPGDVLMSVVDKKEMLDVIALLPGEDRPQLAVGMTMRLEITGYPYEYQSIGIQSIASDVVSPAEARRVVGAEVADSLELRGPVVIVRGRLPDTSFVIDGRTYSYHDGMYGAAEVRVRSEPIVYALLPGTRRFR